MMDIAPLIPWIGALLSIIALGTQLRTILSSGEKKLDERVVKAETKLIEHDRRIQTIENEMKHLPSNEGLHRQQLDISEMKGEIGIIKKSIETTERTARRVEEFLMNHKRED